MSSDKQSALDLLPVSGIRLSAVSAGIKNKPGPDLVLMEVNETAQTAAVFTQNAFCAAPVIIARQHLSQQQPRYLLINSGNANAGTGQAGMDAANACCQLLASEVKCEASQVLPFSTGVIAKDLPVEKFESAMPALVSGLSADGWNDAATGIMTTDTVAKGVSKQCEIDGATITITGFAKGSGMIRPDMATMLAYIATDVCIDQATLKQCLLTAVDHSFNRITVDGDTSTNDACVLIATNQADNAIIENRESESYLTLCETVSDVCQILAKWIVKDGEGATKLVTVQVDGGESGKECERVAYTIAHSPLVKTALFASDPNWGRILAAVGRAGVKDLDINAIKIFLDNVCIVRDGGRDPDYQEEDGQKIFDRDEFTIRVSLGRGESSVSVWTYDFSYDYVRINAEYRT